MEEVEQTQTGPAQTQYVYASEGQLLQVSTPQKTIDYRHNALGQRVAKVVNGEVVEHYLWQDLTTLLATYDGEGNLKQRFEYTVGHTPTSFTQNGQRYYIQTDHLGSPRVITDSSGSVVKVIRYDSYGNITQDSNPDFEIPFGFAGGLYDPDTKLIRFGYRDYDPETGRWTARDPIGFAGGDTNLYGYVLGDPVNFIDPNGKFAINIIGGVFNAVISAGVTAAQGGSVAEIVDQTLIGLVTGLINPAGAVARAGVGILGNIASQAASKASCENFDFSEAATATLLGATGIPGKANKLVESSTVGSKASRILAGEVADAAVSTFATSAGGNAF